MNPLVRKLVLCALVTGLGVAASPAVALPSYYTNPNPYDVNKLHDDGASGPWGTVYWNDVNNNGRWDSGETLGKTPDPGWTHVGKTDQDLTCWIASAADMLASAGLAAGGAEQAYWDMVAHFGFDGGWQHNALSWYLYTLHPAQTTIRISYYGVVAAGYGNPSPWPTAPFDFASSALVAGDQVGIVVHDVDINNYIYHAITYQGYDDLSVTVKVSDSDQTWGGLDTYHYTLASATGWGLSDYRPGLGTDIDYMAILHVPEPSVLMLLVAALLMLQHNTRSRVNTSQGSNRKVANG